MHDRQVAPVPVLLRQMQRSLTDKKRVWRLQKDISRLRTMTLLATLCLLDEGNELNHHQSAYDALLLSHDSRWMTVIMLLRRLIMHARGTSRSGGGAAGAAAVAGVSTTEDDTSSAHSDLRVATPSTPTRV